MEVCGHSTCNPSSVLIYIPVHDGVLHSRSQQGHFSLRVPFKRLNQYFCSSRTLQKLELDQRDAELVQIRYYLLLIWTLTGRFGSVLPLTYIRRSIRAFLGSHRDREEQNHQVQAVQWAADKTCVKIISMSTALVHQINRLFIYIYIY